MPGPEGVASTISGRSSPRVLSRTWATPGSGVPPYRLWANGHHMTMASQPAHVSGTVPNLNSTPRTPASFSLAAASVCAEPAAITNFISEPVRLQSFEGHDRVALVDVGPEEPPVLAAHRSEPEHLDPEAVRE